MGEAFDDAKNDDSFYLPPEAFDNPEFKRGLKLFLSPDGKAARMIITHEGDPATPQGISHIDPIRQAAQEALKGTPLAGSSIYIGGTASTYKDMQDSAKYDLLIVAIAALCLILLIMMFITRSLVAALVIVGTVALSLGASFGLSVLVWQHMLGIQLYWIVLALAVIILLAVGSDYNLLVISRFKEEIGAGLNTGLIRTMAGTGSVCDRRGPGVRVHDGVIRRRRPAGARPDRHDHRRRPDLRHPDRSLVHDPVDRRADGPVVLVAPEGAAPPRQCDAAALRRPAVGTGPASVRGRGRRGVRRAARSIKDLVG